MDTRTSTSSQMVDLVKRPISVSYQIAEELGKGKQCKVIAARVMAARAILKAAEGSGTHLEQVLDRTEGKVASNELPAGAAINFIFNVAGELGIRQVGDVVQGVLANGVNPLPAESGLVPPKMLAQCVSPASTPNPTHDDNEGYHGAD